MFFGRDLESGKFILIQHKGFPLRGDDQVKSEIVSEYVLGFEASRSSDVAVPTFVAIIIDIINGKNVIPAVIVESLDKAIAAPDLK